jgi:hypothetical protein
MKVEDRTGEFPVFTIPAENSSVQEGSKSIMNNSAQAESDSITESLETMKQNALDSSEPKDTIANHSDNKAFHIGHDPFLPKAKPTNSKSPIVLNADPRTSETDVNIPQPLGASISPTPIKTKETHSTKTPPEATVHTPTKETTKISF